MENRASINTKEWDYTEQAQFYHLRPNYDEQAIDTLIEKIKKINPQAKICADIGAGTGNLTVMLQARGLDVSAVEPNYEMRKRGIERTKTFDNVNWSVGTGENTGLESNAFDIVTFGSSFNTTNREKTMLETIRLLKDKGFFVCMWNNRELEKDPVQKKVEEIIKKYVPNYSHGTRREDQTEVIKKSNLFDEINYIEKAQLVKTELNKYIEAWRSVKNNFWDLLTNEGQELFSKIEQDIREEFKTKEYLEITYTTKIWYCQKK